MTKTEIVEVDHLNVTLGSNTVLSDISFRVRAGESIAIVGRNGAGKSTLMRALTGLVRTTSGSAYVLGHALNAQQTSKSLRSLRSEVAQVFQGLHLVLRLTALENVLIGGLGRNRSVLALCRIFSKEEIDRGRDALRAVGLDSKESQRVDSLSGGERQKVAVARALFQEAKLILADEPTASLDPRSSIETSEMLKALTQKRGLTLISVVHSLVLLPHIAERVIGLKKGKLSFDLPLADAKEDLLRALYIDE